MFAKQPVAEFFLHPLCGAVAIVLGAAISGSAFSAQDGSRVEAIQAESFAPPESVNLASPWTPSSELMDLSYLNVGEGLDTTQGLQKPIPVPVPTPLIIGAIGLVATLAIRGKVRN